MKRILFLLLAAVVAVGASAVVPADSLYGKLRHSVGLDFRSGYIVPVHGFYSGENQAGKPVNTSLAGHLKYAFRFAPESRMGRLYPSAYQGLGVAFNSFGSSELGTPVSVYAFQGARIARLSSRLSLDYEWNFGAAFGWNEYNAQTNPFNKVIGSKINAYMNVGFLLNWQLDKDWSLQLGVEGTHFSNGNSNYPNRGLNTLGARIGVVRKLGGGEEEDAVGGDAGFDPHFSYDLIVYGAGKKRGVEYDGSPYIVSGTFGVVGLNFNPMYNVNRYFRVGASLDMKYDESANLAAHVAGVNGDDIRFFRPSFREQMSVGLSARVEFVMPIFSINFGMGYNVLHKGHDTGGWYQVLALKTHITPDFFLHTGYELSRLHDPQNLMLGIGYRFHSR